jgi:hypothetical protein
MTARAWSIVVAHSSDANFRAWGSDVSTSFGLVGLVQTNDTGQINWTTAIRPTVSSTYAGYEIWRFSDSSIFLKIEYGTNSSSSSTPGLRLAVGTGSDGAGNLTGTVSTATTVHPSTSLNLFDPSNPKQSFMSHSVGRGFLGVMLWNNLYGSDSAWGEFMVCRTTDQNGVPSNIGATVYCTRATTGGSSTYSVQALNFQTNSTRPVNTVGEYSFIPHGITSTLVGTDQQAFMHWTAMPRVYPVPQMLTVLESEFATGQTFSTTPIGTIPRTYITLSNRATGDATATGSRCAMLWE